PRRHEDAGLQRAASSAPPPCPARSDDCQYPGPRGQGAVRVSEGGSVTFRRGLISGRVRSTGEPGSGRRTKGWSGSWVWWLAVRPTVGSMAAAPPSRRRRARVLSSLLACLALASSADAKCHKDCKRVIADTLKACKGACPRKSAGRECRQQCTGSREANLAAC